MPRIVTVFRQMLRDDVPEEYQALSAELERIARSSPGFIEFREFTAQDGEHLAIAIFETAEAEASWRDNAAHRAAQRRGREKFYQWYDVSVCEELRNSHWEA
jgi:heme-degrading monooxygenase HmoA